MAMPAPVSSAYCVPYQYQFEIDYGRKGGLLSDHRFSIKDAQGTLLFDVKSRSELHTRRVLCDASGNVLVLLKDKILTLHSRWSAYRGEDENDSNLLFTLSKSAHSKGTPSFDVLLASNKTSQPDFTIKGDYKKYNYDVLFNGTPVAEVRKKISKSWVNIGKKRAHGVTLFPGVDHAFIASVVTIMDQLKEDGDAGGQVKVGYDAGKVGGGGDGGGGGGGDGGGGGGDGGGGGGGDGGGGGCGGGGCGGG